MASTTYIHSWLIFNTLCKGSDYTTLYMIFDNILFQQISRLDGSMKHFLISKASNHNILDVFLARASMLYKSLVYVYPSVLNLPVRSLCNILCAFPLFMSVCSFGDTVDAFPPCQSCQNLTTLWLESTRKYIPISRMSPNHVQSGRSPGVIFSKKCTNPFAFFQ